jgi:hypothetical protein
VITGCTPCDPGRYYENVKTDVLLCPMVNCPIIYPAPPVIPPTQPIPGCSPCGNNNQFGVTSPHTCMIMCEY